jgi:chromosome segregation ATPase
MRNTESHKNSSKRSKTSLLRVAEYSSLAASVFGIVIASISRQMVYAATPLSMSIFLNILNRQRFEEQIKRNLSTKVIRIEQHLSNVDRSFSQLQQDLNESLSRRNSDLDRVVTNYQREKVDLKSSIARLEANNSAIAEQFTEECQAVSRQVEFLNSFVTPQSIQLIKQKLTDLQNRITEIKGFEGASVAQEVTQLRDRYEGLLTFSDRLKQELNVLRKEFANNSDNKSQNQKLDRIQSQIEKLETWRNQQSITDRELNKVQDLISDRQQQSQLISRLQKEFTSFQNAIESRVNDLDTSDRIKLIQSQIEQILTWKNEEVNSDRYSQLQQDLSNFQNAIESRVSNLDTSDRINSIQSQIEQILTWKNEEVNSDRQQHLDRYSQLQQDLSNFQNAIESRVSNLDTSDRINSIQSQIEQILAWKNQELNSNLQQHLDRYSQLQQDLANFQNTIESCFSNLDTTEKINSIQSQIEELLGWKNDESEGDRYSQLQQDLSNFQNAIESRFTSLVSSEQIHSIQSQIEQILTWKNEEVRSEQYSQLQQDLSNFQNAIESRFTNLDASDRINSIQSQIEQILTWKNEEVNSDRQQQLDKYSQLQQDLSNFQNAIEHRFTSLDASNRIDSIQSQIEQILTWKNEEVNSDRQQHLDRYSQLQQDLSNFQNAIESRFTNLVSSEQIHSIQSQIESILTWKNEEVNSDRYSQLQQDLSNFQNAIESRVSNLDTSDRINSIQSQIEQIFTWKNEEVNSDRYSQLQQDLSNFQNAIESRVSNLDTSDRINSIQSQIEQILTWKNEEVNSDRQQQLDKYSQLQQDLSNFQNAIESRVNNLDTTEKIHSIQSRIEELLTWKSQELESDRDEDLDRYSQLQEDLINFQEEIEQKVNKLDTTKKISVIQSQIEHIITQIIDWKSQESEGDSQEDLDKYAQLQEDLANFQNAIDERIGDLVSSEQLNSIQFQIEEILTWKNTELRSDRQLNNIQDRLDELLHWKQQQVDWEAELAQLKELIKDLKERYPDGDDRDLDKSDVDLELIALNLGIDFGTSFTKVCFRDIAQDRSEIVIFSDRGIDLNEAIIPTKIGIATDGTLITGLTTTEWENRDRDIEKSIEFIKMRLLDLDITQQNEYWRLEHFSELDSSETIENLCAYYLCCIIKRTQAWIRQYKPDLILDRQVEWTANIGVPVEYYDSPALDRFEKVLSLAWLLSSEPLTESFTIETLGDRLQHLRTKLTEKSLDCHAIPEISAEAWSFVNAVGSREGFYVFFDIGDGTLDGASFHYWRDGGEVKVDFYSSVVKPLGLNAISQALAAELDVSSVQVQQIITGENYLVLPEIKSSRSRRQIQQLVGRVAIEGKDNISNCQTIFKEFFLKDGLNMFIGGGGSQTSFYTNTILNTHTDFQHQNMGISNYNHKPIPIPGDLDLNGLKEEKFNRFAVAYGLSIPQWEMPEIRLPSTQMEESRSQRA